LDKNPNLSHTMIIRSDEPKEEKKSEKKTLIFLPC
jgi:hypothetical protein